MEISLPRRAFRERFRGIINLSGAAIASGVGRYVGSASHKPNRGSIRWQWHPAQRDSNERKQSREWRQGCVFSYGATRSSVTNGALGLITGADDW
jgi:hypothetical protein